jgi:hypothetical protein
VLAYVSPLPKAPVPKLVILVTGDSCASKDYCGGVWVSAFNSHFQQRTPEQTTNPSGHTFHTESMARVVSISDVTKREYAKATPDVDVSRLLGERAYKEIHRPALTEFFKEQMRRQPGLPEEHFLCVVNNAVSIPKYACYQICLNCPAFRWMWTCYSSLV